MAELLHSLLSVPDESKGFTAHQFRVGEQRSTYSHPHKKPRLDVDVDSGPRGRGKGKAVDKDEPLIIEIHDFVGASLHTFLVIHLMLLLYREEAGRQSVQ